MWQPKAGLVYIVSYTMLYSYTKQNQQLETNCKPIENNAMGAPVERIERNSTDEH